MSLQPIQKSDSATTSTGEVAANRTIQEVPKGVGAAPTTIQSAAEPAKELGYVESAVQWLASLISSIFKIIFCCFFKAEDVDVQEELPPLLVPPTEQPEIAPPPLATEVAPPAAAVVEGPSQPAATMVREDVSVEANLLKRFNKLTDEEQQVIYRKIGENEQRSYYLGQYFRSRAANLASIIETGKLKVKESGMNLQDYLKSN